ncbi:MAG TPA: hypothetical protein VNI83_10055 [Vicinamibacterales bacterium]|nr:hypothetical protein [Vicinamibacterales bacterium]
MRVRSTAVFALAFAVLAAMPVVSPAQDAKAAELPPARRIIDRYVEALGGRDLARKYRSRRATGRVTLAAQGLEGRVEILAARPDLLRIRLSIPGVGDLESGHDGRIGWISNPLTGPMVIEGRALEQLRADADFDAALHEPSRYKVLETLERTEFEGRPAYKLRAVRDNGDEDIEFFDVDSGLLLGTTTTRETPMGAVTSVTVVGDYRRFGGLLLPTRVVQRAAGTEQVITIESVEFDVVDPERFVPPPAVRTLAK